ncbi:hypothetical protein LY78DRAFT_347621 [Colletotrichum sublineola]|nr:hypothetical protein LY78DRAFT_347621 [Colletotrichum sublineola]
MHNKVVAACLAQSVIKLMMYTIFFFLFVFYVSSNVHPRLLSIWCSLRKPLCKERAPTNGVSWPKFDLNCQSKSLPIPSGMCDVMARELVNMS